jgi:hypothetical protein
METISHPTGAFELNGCWPVAKEVEVMTDSSITATSNSCTGQNFLLSIFMITIFVILK